MAIIDKVVSHWPLDSSESGGIVADVHGSLTLTDRNTCSTSTGVVGGCIYCTASNQENVYWDDGSTDADTFTLSAGRGFVVWAKTQGYFDAYTRRVISKSGQYEIYRTNSSYSPNLQLKLHPSSGSAQYYLIHSALTTSTWYMIYFAINDAGTAAVTSVNGAAKSSHGTFVDFENASTSRDLELGAWSGTGDTTRYWDALIDEATAFSSELSNAELSELYNSGAGVAYPFSASTSAASSLYYYTA